MFIAYLMSGVPSLLTGPAVYDDRGAGFFVCDETTALLLDCLFTEKRMSGVPSRFTGDATLPDEGTFAWGPLFTLKRMSGVPSFLTGQEYGVLSLGDDFEVFWEDACVTASLFTLNLLSGVPSFFNGRPPW